MKTVKRFLILLVALSVMMCMTVLAGEIESITEQSPGVTTQVLEGNVALDVTYSGANDGGMYLILVLSEEGVPTADNILYVNQVTAEGTTVTFGNVYPMEIPTEASYVYMAGTNVSYAKLAKINPKQAVAPAYLLGDINGDGNQDMADISLILQYINGSVMLTATQSLAADVNGDGNQDMADVSLILQFINGAITKFPAEQ